MSDPSLLSNFRTLIDISFQAGLKNILLGSGLAVSSFAIVLSVFNYFLQKFVTLFNQIDPTYINLVGILGFDKAFSIIISAYIIRLTILTFKVSIIKGS